MTTATETAFETLTVETSDRVCTITLNRPEVFNAFNDAMTFELQDALKQVARDTEVGVIVLTGAGKAFCSGQDLGALKSKYTPGYIPEFGKDLDKRYNPIVERIFNMDKPVIASINGVAAGAGCSLALACDIRIASDKASLIEVFINVALIPDSGSTYTLPRLVGLGKAKELCFTGDKVDAAEALRLGLVNRVVSPEELAAETQAMAQKLARLPAHGIALTKRLLNQSFDNDLKTQLQAESFAQDTAGKTEDHVEGVMAFLEKRKPEFKGK